jgi:hypothetical protein
MNRIKRLIIYVDSVGSYKSLLFNRFDFTDGIRLARISRPPPRKVSGWTIFVQEYLYQLRVRGIKPDITGISPTISKKWRALSPAEKQVYIDKAKERKEELNDAYNVWFKSLTPEQLVIYYRIVTLRRELLSSEASSTTKKAVLKRPPTSFLRFFADMRKSRLQDLPILDQAREAARLWAELPEAEKEVYQTISKQEMEEYKKKKMEMYQYKELNLIRQQLTKDLKVFAGRK